MNEIKEVSNDECDYEKDYMKIKFNSDDSTLLEGKIVENKKTKFSHSNFRYFF